MARITVDDCIKHIPNRFELTWMVKITAMVTRKSRKGVGRNAERSSYITNFTPCMHCLLFVLLVVVFLHIGVGFFAVSLVVLWCCKFAVAA